MKFVHVITCAALISFFAGIVWSTPERNLAVAETDQTISIPKGSVGRTRTLTQPLTYNTDDPNLFMPKQDTDSDLKPCSETNTMPCEVSPRNPVKEELDAKESRPGLFKRGEAVTCIYPAIYSWTDGNQFIKNVGMKCTVVQASEPWDDLEKDYQHIQVDCSKDIDFQSSSQPGVGMVKDHKLMFKVRWFSSTDCYHFQQQ